MPRGPSLADRLAHLRSTQPDLYRALAGRYGEAILAIEQDRVLDIEDAVDGDVEDELFDLGRELDRIDRRPRRR